MPPTSLSLKQRLANLANSASSPSSPQSSSSNSYTFNANSRSGSSTSLSGLAAGLTSSPRRKPLPFFNNPPWKKDGNGSGGSAEGRIAIHGVEETRRVEEVLSRMIFQAGVDYETRPMVILNASAFPDPQDVSYDLLLTRLLAYLDLFVESDYTVVFFAAGVRHAPSWNWVWKAYRSLSRKYRKNLKRLYIVHSSFFSKMLFSLAGAIISPKFFRKITYVNNLSTLACHVPLTQIDIPPAVYQENLKHEAQIQVPTPSRSHMFGVPLEELMGYDGEKDGIPRVVKDCIQYLREAGLEEQGLFRRSPNSVTLRQVREAYNRGQPVSLRAFNDPHLAAVLLKKFLRDLPEPLFPENLYPIILRCPKPVENDAEAELEAVRYVREIILPELIPCGGMVLSAVLNLLHDVSLRSRTNLMDARNLALVVTPSLVMSGNPIKDMHMYAVGGVPTLPNGMATMTMRMGGAGGAGQMPGSSDTESQGTPLGSVIKLCIERYYEIFDEVKDRTEAVQAQQVIYNSSNRPPSETLSPDANKHFRIHDSDEESASGRSSSSHDRRPSREGTRPQRKGLIERTIVTASSPGSTSRRAWNMNAHQSAFAVSGVQQDQPRRGADSPSGSASISSSPSPSSPAGSKSRTRSLFADKDNSPSSGKHGTRRAALGPQATVTPSANQPKAAGTVRKAAGSGVTAVGVTASGFFSPPGEA